MSKKLNIDPPAEDRIHDLLPRYNASDFPVTRFTRWAFQVWVICFLFTLIFTLGIYLIDKFQGG